MKSLAKDLESFIKRNNLSSTTLYTNMKEYAKVSQYGHRGIVALTFEGELYEALNCAFEENFNGKLYRELHAICDKHNVYYEQGNAWNCAFYKV